MKAIKESVLDISGFKMRCYVCDDCNRYFNADDVENFFHQLENGLEFTEEDAIHVAKFLHGKD